MARLLRLAAPLAVALTLSAVPAGLALPQAPAASAAPPPASTTAPAASASASPAAGESAPAPAAPAFPVEEYKLSNGLRVILAPDQGLPSVAVRVLYHVGHRDEPEGLEGIAHLVEHLMFMCSSHVPRGKLFRILGDAGAVDVNGTTGFDRTLYHETVPPERLELALWLESDRMGYFSPAVDEQALEREKRVVMNELRTRVLDEPAGLAEDLILGATFPDWHPYHRAFSDAAGALSRITLADVRAFAATWLGPANATLVLAGRFERDRAAALVERYFATLPGRPPPARPSIPPLQRRGPTTIEIGADLDSEVLWLTWVTPAFGAPGSAALHWASTWLTEGGPWSPLRQRLVDSGLAQSVITDQLSMALGGVFRLRAIAERGRRAEEVLAALDRELSDLARSGPTEEEMRRIRSYWATGYMHRLESADGRASVLGSTAVLGPLALPFDWSGKRMQSLTAADVRAAAQRLLPARRTAVILARFRPGAPVGGVVVRREEP